MRYSIVATILHKELLDTRRDKRTLFMMVVLPVLLYPATLLIGTQALLVTSSTLPDDLAYAVVKAVVENFADFRRLHPVLSKLDVEDMVPRETVIPIHPGALKYFHEAGLVQ